MGTKRLLHRHIARYCLLYSESVRHLAESEVSQEGIAGHVGRILDKEEFGYRVDDRIELGVDNVAEQDGAGAAFRLDPFVVRKVDGDFLDARIVAAAIIQGVAHEDVGVEAGIEHLVFFLAGQFLLEFGNQGGIFA